MAIDFDIRLQPKQGQAMRVLENDGPMYLFFGGAKFGGKSYLARAKEVVRRLSYPGTVGGIFRKSYPELLQNHIRAFLREFPIIARKGWYKQTERAIFWPNGSITQFQYLSGRKALDLQQGIEYDDITLDEATQHEEETIKVLKTALRMDPKIAKRHPEYRPKFLLTGNPGGLGHSFVRRVWVDRQFKDGEEPGDYAFIQSRYTDNKMGTDANPAYVRNLRDLPRDLRKAYLDGDWNIFAGQYFSQLTPEAHLCEPFEIPDNWNRFRSMDWGYAHNCCVLWWATNPQGKSFIYRHYLDNEKTPRKVARSVLDMTPKHEKVYTTLAGGDLWKRIQTEEYDSLHTYTDLMEDEGLYLERANNARIPGWHTLLDLLDPEQEKGPDLQIFKTCEPVYAGLQRVIHDDLHVEDVMKMDGDDEADTVRYGAQHLSRGRKLEEPKDPISAVIDRLEKQHLVDQEKYEEWGQN